MRSFIQGFLAARSPLPGAHAPTHRSTNTQLGTEFPLPEQQPIFRSLHLIHLVPIPGTQAYSSLRTTHVGISFQVVPGAKRGGGEGHGLGMIKLGVTCMGLESLGCTLLPLERVRSEDPG